MTSLEEEQIALLQKAIRPQNSQHKIQKVANYLRDRNNFTKHFLPILVSFGPIHHGSKNLQLGEQYKLMWAAKYIESKELTTQFLYQKITDNIVELKNLFAEDVLSRFEEKKLSWMLFVDGCALLHIIEKLELYKPEAINVKVDQLLLVMMDVLLLENQLPYLILKMLWKDENEIELMKIMKNFLMWDNNNEVNQKNYLDNEQPNHLLDLHRSIIIRDSPNSKTKHNEANYHNNLEDTVLTLRKIQELQAVGIRLKSGETRSIRDVSFSHGWLGAELMLPKIVVDDATASTFLNLIVYELCPDFENDFSICSFMSFMNSLIDQPEDVKELRSAGILLNCLGTDADVVNLFNYISKGLIIDNLVYSRVRSEIEMHFSERLKTWIALFIHTYLSNPIAFLAATLALVLSIVQTWFAIHPSKN